MSEYIPHYFETHIASIAECSIRVTHTNLVAVIEYFAYVMTPKHYNLDAST